MRDVIAGIFIGLVLFALWVVALVRLHPRTHECVEWVTSTKRAVAGLRYTDHACVEWKEIAK